MVTKQVQHVALNNVEAVLSEKLSESLTEKSFSEKVFLREQLESVRIKNIITKLPQSHH